MNAITIDALELAQHRPQLLKFAMLRLRNHARAEDAVQDTLLAAIEAADRFAGDSSVRTWLTGILKHKIVDHIRRHSREVRVKAAGDDPPEGFEPLREEDDRSREQPAQWGDPAAALAQGEFFARLEACLARLPEQTARAFVMSEVMGLSTGEICRTLGVSDANCWVRLHRARVRLRESLRDCWLVPEAGGQAPGAPLQQPTRRESPAERSEPPGRAPFPPGARAGAAAGGGVEPRRSPGRSRRAARSGGLHLIRHQPPPPSE